jgi:predicted secreted protein
MATYDGLLTKAYAGAAGSEATTELTGILDDTISQAGVEADVTTKGSATKIYAVVNHDISVSFTLLYDPAVTQHAAIRTAYEGKGLISLLFLDGPKNVAGHKGVGGDFIITQFDRAAPIDGKVAYSVTAKPGLSSAYPVAFRASSGS